MLDELLRTVAAQGRTVVMTSHDLARAEDLGHALRHPVTRQSLRPPRHAGNCAEATCFPSIRKRWQAEMDSILARKKAAQHDQAQQSRSHAAAAVPTPAHAQFLRAVGAIAWKDLAAEFRSRELFSAMMVFSLLVIMIFNFALELDIATRQIGHLRCAVGDLCVRRHVGPQPLAEHGEGPGLPRRAPARAGRPRRHLLRQGHQQPGLHADRRSHCPAGLLLPVRRESVPSRPAAHHPAGIRSAILP